MAENDTPTPPPPAPAATTPAPTPAAKPAAKKTEDYDRAHVPMGEEFDKAKWTMPPWQPVVAALVIVGIVLGIVAYLNRAKPPASGGIDEVTAVAIPGDSVMAAINVHFANSSDYTVKVHGIKATVQTSKGEFSDEAANASDYDRYYQAFPDLKQNAKTPLMQDARVAPGANGIGTIIVSFPITKDVFDSRQSLTVTVQPYDGLPIVLKK
jgi:hypothetical protein